METPKTIPKNFVSVINDFTNDLSVTFPEHNDVLQKWTANITEEDVQGLFSYCLTVYPERFFDILYQNDEIFKVDSVTNTLFLPDLDFKLLYNCDNLSENSKKTIWKYLQLILFSVIHDVKDKSGFGDTMNMFDSIDEKELQEKLKDTMSGISDFLNKVTENMDKKDDATPDPKFNAADFEKMFENMPKPEDFKDKFPFDKMPDMSGMPGMSGMSGMPGMPDIENIHEHLKSLFDGKIGSLAKEMAEEISEDFKDILGDDLNDIGDTGDAMKKLMKNPKKIMDLMKKISGKLDDKMKSGDISKDELMKEAAEMMGKMKDMGGVDQFKEMFQNLTKNMGSMGKNMRFDTNAMDRMAKKQTMREKLLKKIELKKQQDLQNTMRAANFSLQPDGSSDLVFRLNNEEAQQKSLIAEQQLLAEIETENSMKTPQPEKKKNNKKKKSKK
jgi:hypothetical protein